jgi:hypothetical protein
MRTRLVQIDQSTRRLLCAIVFLLGVITLELWVGRPGDGNALYAQIPDTGMQRLQIVEETRKTNQLLSEILDHLRNQRVKVLVDSADKKETRPLPKQR